MFSSKSFVMTVTLQLFRTSDLFGSLLSQLFCFQARFHCYFVCSLLYSQPIPMRLPSIHQTMWSLARPQTFRQRALPHSFNPLPFLSKPGNIFSPPQQMKERLQFEQRGIISSKKLNLDDKYFHARHTKKSLSD